MAVSWDTHLAGGRELRSLYIALEAEPAVRTLGQANYWGRALKRNQERNEGSKRRQGKGLSREGVLTGALLHSNTAGSSGCEFSTESHLEFQELAFCPTVLAVGSPGDVGGWVKGVCA